MAVKVKPAIWSLVRVRRSREFEIGRELTKAVGKPMV